ncbi:MAG: hypothetical protein MIO90_07940 [Methanomassiliicoccales archaeon]|nr:hypothetical protein [Methanomassiliicoccales archaeon]
MAQDAAFLASVGRDHRVQPSVHRGPLPVLASGTLTAILIGLPVDGLDIHGPSFFKSRIKILTDRFGMGRKEAPSRSTENQDDDGH